MHTQVSKETYRKLAYVSSTTSTPKWEIVNAMLTKALKGVTMKTKKAKPYKKTKPTKKGK